MNASPGSAVKNAATQRGRRLRFPTLFVLVGLLFLVDLLVPDFIPFIDEIILGLITVMLGLWREKRRPGEAESAERVD